MNLKDNDIEKLIKIMQENDVSELNVKKGNIAIEIKRGQGYIVEKTIGQMPISIPNGTIKDVISEPANVKETPRKQKSAEEESITSRYYEIKSPLVGTFYQASAPDADSFVEVGDHIKKGDTLCIVEAMKSMNEIEADVNGVVKEICIENANLVEYDQVLFRIEK